MPASIAFMPTGGDIEAAARSLGVEIADNATVVQRAQAAVGRIETGYGVSAAHRGVIRIQSAISPATA